MTQGFWRLATRQSRRVKTTPGKKIPFGRASLEDGMGRMFRA
jgi:hypothetical protein